MKAKGVHGHGMIIERLGRFCCVSNTKSNVDSGRRLREAEFFFDFFRFSQSTTTLSYHHPFCLLLPRPLPPNASYEYILSSSTMCFPCCVCVSTSEVVVVERLGKFDRLLPAGLGCFFCPCEQRAGIVSFREFLAFF